MKYKTIASPVTGEYRDRGSKFIAYAFPVGSEEEALQRLAEVRKQHPKARHHCFAWRLGASGERFRANDDGEPSGTAGRPILGQIDRFGLTQIAVVVVRYFGGTLLGTSGLIQAYRGSTADALEQAEIVERIEEDFFLITFDYALMSPLMTAVKKLGLRVVRQDFAEQARLQIALPSDESAALLHKLKAMIAGKREAELGEEEVVEGLEIGGIGESGESGESG